MAMSLLGMPNDTLRMLRTVASFVMCLNTKYHRRIRLGKTRRNSSKNINEAQLLRQRSTIHIFLILLCLTTTTRWLIKLKSLVKTAPASSPAWATRADRTLAATARSSLFLPSRRRRWSPPGKPVLVTVVARGSPPSRGLVADAGPPGVRGSGSRSRLRRHGGWSPGGGVVRGAAAGVAGRRWW